MRGDAAGTAAARAKPKRAVEAAAEPAPIRSERAASGAAASTSGQETGAALRAMQRTARLRSWGRAQAVPGKAVAGRSKRARAAASLEADPQTFMREISKTALLSGEQEKRLAGFVQERQAVIEAGQAFRTRTRRVPSEDEWAEAAGLESVAQLKAALGLGMQVHAAGRRLGWQGGAQSVVGRHAVEARTAPAGHPLLLPTPAASPPLLPLCLCRRASSWSAATCAWWSPLPKSTPTAG